MLVNVSRFVDVQKVVFDLVSGVVNKYRTAIDMHSVAYANGTPHGLLDDHGRRSRGCLRLRT